MLEHRNKDLENLDDEKNKFGFGWSKFNQSYVPPHGYQAIYDSFQYRDSYTLEGLPIQSKFNTYEGGGYVYEMRGQLSFIQGNMTLLKAMNWIDRQTRAVFIEFSAYNPNINLIMVSMILVEFTSSGSLLTMAKFDTLNLFGEVGQGFVSFKIVCEILFFCFIIYFMIIEVKELIQSSLKVYLSQFWTFIEWSIILTAWVAFVMFAVRLNKAEEVLDFFKRTNGYGFMKLQKINECNQILTFSLGLCACFTTIKSLKLLRFNRNINYLSQTLKLCLNELISFSGLFFLFWIAFVQLMHLIYGPHYEGYSTMIKSMETAFLSILGKFDIMELTMASPVLGPIIFAAYFITSVYFALNIFISIIVEAFDKIRGEAKKKPNEFDLLIYGRRMVEKKLMKKSVEPDLIPHTKYRDHISIMLDRIQKLINYTTNVR
jgi:hypothetical protein